MFYYFIVCINTKVLNTQLNDIMQQIVLSASITLGFFYLDVDYRCNLYAKLS